MYVVAESPVDALRAEFRAAARAPVLLRLSRRVVLHWQRRMERAMAAQIRQLNHPGVQADYAAARQAR